MLALHARGLTWRCFGMAANFGFSRQQMPISWATKSCYPTYSTAGFTGKLYGKQAEQGS
jgi:hypothetical protein